MITIESQNPSINQYIKDMGKDKIEEMIITYLEIKSKFYSTNKKENISEPLYKQFGVSKNLHHKLLELNTSKNSSAIDELREDIHSKIKDNNMYKPIENVRDEYFKSKGYL